MEGRFLLDVIIGQGAAILKLLSSEDQTLLVWGDAFFILNFALYIIDGIRRFHLQGNSLSCEGFDNCLYEFVSPFIFYFIFRSREQNR